MSNYNLVEPPYNGQTTKIENKKKKGKIIKYAIGGLAIIAVVFFSKDCNNCKGCSGLFEIGNGKENDLDVSGDDAELRKEIPIAIQKLANDLVNKITEPTTGTVKETNLKIASTLVEDANDWKEQLENQETEPEIIDGETDLEDSKEDDNQKEDSNNSNSNKPSSNTRPSGGSSSNDTTIESPEKGETIPTPPPATPIPTPPPATPTPTPPPATPTPTPPPATPTPTPPPATPTPPPDKIDGSTTDGDGQTDIGEGETDEIVFPSDPTDNMGEQQNSSSMPNDAEPTQDEIVFPMGTPKVSSGDANDISSRKNILMEMKMFCQRISMYQSSLEDSMVESVGTVKQYYS